MPKTILVFLLALNLLMFNVSMVFAQNSGYDYTKAGVGEQIREFLCAPSDPDPRTTQLSGSQVDFAAQNNKASGDLYNCINRLYRFAILTAAVVGVFFIVIAGYLYMGASGNQESIDKAKNILVTTVTALVILFSGYILLKAINPDLIQFRSIQPGSVKLTLAEPPNGEPTSGQIPQEGLATAPLENRGGGSIEQLNSAGCDITSEARPRNELPNLTSTMWSKLLQICQIASQTGIRPKVSSTVRRESKGSYHQVGCAVDFSDSLGNGFFDIITKKGRSSGLAIYQAAKQAGINEARINPSPDDKQTYHIHIDLGTSCPK